MRLVQLRRRRGPVSLLVTGTLLAAIVLWFAGMSNAHGAGVWVPTGTMNAARTAQTATLLPNGKVLIAGGQLSLPPSPVNLASAELYDPATGVWSPTGSMTVARASHRATLLPNGKILVTGGESICCNVNTLASAELYDPATGAWSATASMSTPRHGHTATLLPNGKVLVAGGYNGAASAELYDPATGTWSSTGSMSTGRLDYTATLLPNGKVLAVGGKDVQNTTSAELYDPNTGVWTLTGSMSAPRGGQTATLLPGGKVLVAGGTVGGLNTSAYQSSELYDPSTGVWTPTGSLVSGRYFHTATLLSTGDVLVSGGYPGDPGGPVLASAELYHPVAGTWSTTATIGTMRSRHTATLLLNGDVLVSGGDTGPSIASAELYTLSPGSPGPTTPAPAPTTPGPSAQAVGGVVHLLTGTSHGDGAGGNSWPLLFVVGAFSVLAVAAGSVLSRRLP